MYSMNNLLPHDGTAFYYGSIFDSNHSEVLLQKLLLEIPWKNDEAFIYGKHIITKRKVAWFGNEKYAYKYSNASRLALPWTPLLIDIKQVVEQHTQIAYNSCLLNLYHSGEEGMSWHTDDEKTMAKNGSIASLSFGAERKFAFKHKQTKESISIQLQTGSLLEMKDETQSHWLHALPKSTRVLQPRVNLTFRNFITS